MNFKKFTALTLGGLRILSIGGVCLLKVIAGSERGETSFTVSQKQKITAFNFTFSTALIRCCHSHVGSSNPRLFADEPGLPVPRSVPLGRAHPPGVASSTHAAAVTEEEQQGEQDQRPPGKYTQQHQQQHIVLRLARRHRHILMKSSQEKRSGPQQQYM